MKISLMSTPEIYLSEDAKTKMNLYVDLHPEEISWMGLVERTGDNEFTVQDVYLIKQECSYARTEIDEGALMELHHDLEEAGILPDEDNRDKIGLYLWGHSHHTMSPSPSGTDDAQFKDFLEGRPPFMIRLIMNKRGDYRLDLCMYDEGILLEDMAFTEIISRDENLMKEIKAEIKDKVSKFHIPVSKTSFGGHSRPAQPFLTGARHYDLEGRAAEFDRRHWEAMEARRVGVQPLTDGEVADLEAMNFIEFGNVVIGEDQASSRQIAPVPGIVSRERSKKK